MKKIRSNGVSALETTPVYASQLNEVTEVINKSLGLDADGDGDFIPENVYPVADGEGGFIAGDIKKIDGGVGGNNWKFGNNTLAAITTGGSNIGIGTSSLALLTTGSQNVSVGNSSGSNITTGWTNTLLGSTSGASLVTGGNNVIIGGSAGTAGQVDVNGSIAIGGQAYTTKNLQSVFGEINVIEFISRGVHINTRKTTAKDATATLTAAECLAGVITSTSAAAVALTLPSAADLIAVLNGGGQGTTFELIIDNSAGANSVTITPSATIAAITSPFTVTNPMIVTTAQKVGCFKFYFTSATSAIVSRIW